MSGLRRNAVRVPAICTLIGLLGASGVTLATAGSAAGFTGTRQVVGAPVTAYDTTYATATGTVGGRLASTKHDITGTTNDGLYQRELYGLTAWNLPVGGPGTYHVFLRQAEIYWNAPGKRVYDIAAEGVTKVAGVDLYQRAGAKDRAVQIAFDVEVNDGTLNLGFVSKVDYAKIGSVEVTQIASSTPSPTAAPTTATPTTPAPTRTATPAPTGPVVTKTATPIPTVTTSGFAHPGVVNSAASLAEMKANVLAGRQPWKAAYDRMAGSWSANLSRTPKPVTYVQCGAYSNPNIGCSDETNDAQGAYTQALLWTVSGKQQHADKAIEYFNAWSAVLKDHTFDTTKFVNGRLQAAWAAETFVKAAEIIRYSGAGWKAADVARFETMLRTAFLPKVRDGWTGGGANWLTSMADATMNIGVFTNDRAIFNDGLGDWRRQVPTAIYLSSDGAQPGVPAGTVWKTADMPRYWNNPTRWVDGLEGETCRDAGHMSMGLAGMVLAAETARIQGIDLYGEQQRRITAALEFNAKYLNDPSAAGWPCPTPLKWGGEAAKLTYEVAYNHYAGRSGVSLPETKKWISGTRPKITSLFLNWETLTHGRVL